MRGCDKHLFQSVWLGPRKQISLRDIPLMIWLLCTPVYVRDDFYSIRTHKLRRHTCTMREVARVCMILCSRAAVRVRALYVYAYDDPHRDYSLPERVRSLRYLEMALTCGRVLLAVCTRLI